MKRYNIDTDEGDLIQFDLKDHWTIQREDDKVILIINRFFEERWRTESLMLTMDDLNKIRGTIESILPKDNS